MEGSGSNLIKGTGTIPEFAWSDRGKPQKKHSLRVDIWVWDLPNTMQEC
jgi:hypothetical protein